MFQIRTSGKGKRQQASKRNGSKRPTAGALDGLDRTARNAIKAAAARAEAAGKQKGISAQQTIPYLRMLQDGTCQVTATFYSRLIVFQDITYQLAAEEDQEIIRAGWVGFLNSFSPDASYQLLFENSATSEEQISSLIRLPESQPGFERLQKELSDMLKEKGARGNNGIQRLKYIAFGLEEKSEAGAIKRLDRIGVDLCNELRRIGVSARALNGKEYLEVLHSILHLDTKEPFRFAWDWLPRSGLSTKDFIVPSSFEFRTGKRFKMGDKVCQCSFLQILASELEDSFLTELLEIDNSQVLTMHVRQMDSGKALKQLRHTLTDLQSAKADAQKRAVRDGYDMDNISNELVSSGEDAKSLLNSLRSRDENLFLVTIILMSVADNKRELESRVQQAATIAQRYNCRLTCLDFQQEQGAMSCLPLAFNQVPISRSLTSSALGILIPFLTQELFQVDPSALYYGVNPLSRNLILANRKRLKNPSGLILGTPGGGKSMAAKREILNVMLATTDHIMICDPEGEYSPLVRCLGGETVVLSPSSTQHINPLDISMDYNEEDSPVKLKIEFILSLFEQMVGRKTGLEPEEISAIDMAARTIYQPFLLDPKPENVPILGDLQKALGDITGSEPLVRAGQYLATVIDIYVNGSLNVFNHRTDLDISNRLICFDIKNLGKQLKKIGLLIVEDQIWNRVSTNRDKRQTTRIYLDEFHLFLKDERTAAFSVEICKRFRKWGGIVTGITQNVKDLLATRDIENILDTSDFFVLLNQYGEDREILAKRLNISESQLSYVTQSEPGEGLIIYGLYIIPFSDRIPTDTEMYRIMSTKLTEAV